MIRALALVAALSLAPAIASAATWTLNITGPIELGTVVAAPIGNTVFRVDPNSGAVTVQSGNGRRVNGGPARVRVDISCQPGRGVDTACQTTNIPIRIGVIATVSGRARAFSAFNVYLDSASLAGPITGSNPLMFTLAPLGDNVVKTFYVGADFPVAGDDSGLPTGLGENFFYVYALNGAGVTVAGDTDKGRVTVLRGLSIGPTSPLSFGRIQVPTSGTSTVTLDATTGARTVSGSAVAYSTPAPTRAAFTIAGEGGQQVSINVPSTITLNGPSGSLSVTTSKTAPATTALSGVLGAPGSYSFNVGGSFTLTPTTPTGAYSGVLTVSADYN